MKQIFTLLILIYCVANERAQGQVCNSNGNLVIYSNYDGGTLNIDVDQNIPNLKIGVVAYEAVSINISGAFVANVTGVTFAGYPSTGNTTCGTSGPSGPTTVNGVSSSIVTIQSAPQATLPNTNGNGSIVCAYSCNISSSQGGCNTVDQVVAYFQNQFQGSSLRYHLTQYNCWLNSETKAVSQGGNCCLTPPAAPVADFTVSSDTICTGECLNFTDISINNPTSWSWVFQGGTPSGSSVQNPQNICFQNPGTYTINLTAINPTGSGSVNKNILVLPQPVFINQPLSATNSVGNSQQFTTTLSGTGNQLQWQMDAGTGFSNLNNGGQFSGVNTNTLTVSNITLSNHNQQFRCVATLAGCNDTSETAVLSVLNNTGSAELMKTGISISPNPSSDFISIQNSSSNIGKFTISDMQGKILMSGSLKSGMNRVNLDDLSTGMYLIHFPEISGLHYRLIKK
jgi:PKD repeat protein